MNFAAPWFLAGLVALGIPLYLHLLRQFNRTPQPFSSVRLFDRRVQSATKQRRLRYLALLALRLCLFTLLAFAFADPFVQHQVTRSTSKPLTVIAVDRSFSMRSGDRMQQAKTLAHLMVHAVPRGSRAEVLAVDSHVQTLTQIGGDQGTLDAAVDSIEAGDDASSYGEFARALRVMETTSRSPLAVRFITDAQQTSMPGSFSDLQLGPHTSLHIETVGQHKLTNWSVASVVAPAQVHDANGARILATVAGWNAKDAPKRVQLLLDGKVIAVKDVVVPDCGQTQVEFTDVVIPYGAHRGEIHIEPHDDLPQDDVFAFSVERAERRPVLFLYSHGRSREAIFYQAALASTNIGLDVVTRSVEDTRSEDLSKYAFVVLNDPGTFDEAGLQSFLRKGGAALIAAGPDTTHGGRVPLVQNAIRFSGQIQNATWTEGNGIDLGSVQFLSTPLITIDPRSRVWAKFGDGSPALLQQDVGQGRVLIFGSTLDNATSDFPVHASFVPFVLQTARYLSGETDSPASYVVGSSVSLRKNAGESTAAEVIGPTGAHELNLNEATRTIDYRLDRSGFYDVRRADGHRLLIAANSDRRESDLTTVPAETLGLWATTGSQNGKTAESSSETERSPLWRFILVFGLLAAIAETVYASRYVRQARLTS
jgi:hypothetical protein